jgi:hypothetical protein
VNETEFELFRNFITSTNSKTTDITSDIKQLKAELVAQKSELVAQLVAQKSELEAQLVAQKSELVAQKLINNNLSTLTHTHATDIQNLSNLTHKHATDFQKFTDSISADVSKIGTLTNLIQKAEATIADNHIEVTNNVNKQKKELSDMCNQFSAQIEEVKKHILTSLSSSSSSVAAASCTCPCTLQKYSSKLDLMYRNVMNILDWVSTMQLITNNVVDRVVNDRMSILGAIYANEPVNDEDLSLHNLETNNFIENRNNVSRNVQHQAVKTTTTTTDDASDMNNEKKTETAPTKSDEAAPTKSDEVQKVEPSASKEGKKRSRKNNKKLTEEEDDNADDATEKSSSTNSRCKKHKKQEQDQEPHSDQEF